MRSVRLYLVGFGAGVLAVEALTLIPTGWLLIAGSVALYLFSLLFFWSICAAGARADRAREQLAKKLGIEVDDAA